jgi:hypothetical protein
VAGEGKGNEGKGGRLRHVNEEGREREDKEGRKGGKENEKQGVRDGN